MDRHSIIFVTDLRQQFIGEYLPGKNAVFYLDEMESPEKYISQAEWVILPTPVEKVDKNKTIDKLLKDNLTKNQYVFGGKFSKRWKDFFMEKEISYSDFMEDETVTCENAAITAEATVAEVIRNSRYSIHGQKIIITGFGRCAKEIARKLSALGAKVTILARRAEARREARELGYEAVDFSYGPEEAYGTRVYVNTVPAPVLTKSIIREMHADSVIIDIASKPGGCDRRETEKYGILVVEALGLPGIYTPKSSAKILADAICRDAPPQPTRGKDTSWIYQIII